MPQRFRKVEVGRMRLLWARGVDVEEREVEEKVRAARRMGPVKGRMAQRVEGWPVQRVGGEIVLAEWRTVHAHVEREENDVF